MTYYAKQHPRGFANEIAIHKFGARADRDKWVSEHRDDGDCNSAACGATVCSRREADRILRRKDDAVTEQYSSVVEHGDLPGW